MPGASTKLTDRELMIRIKENLHENDFLSYKEISIALDLKPKTGKSKQLQLNNFYRFMEYEYDEEQKKYLITKIFNRQLPKPPRKLRDDAIYTKYIEILLLSYLKENPGCSKVMSKKMWWLTLSIVNSDYVKYEGRNQRHQILELDYPPAINMENINTFYFRANKRFTTLFFRALDSLVNRRLIEYDRVYMVRYEYDDLHDFHVADDDEISSILDCEHKALESYNMKTRQQLFSHPELVNDYYNTVSRLQLESYGIAEAYSEIKIVHGKRFIESELQYSKEELRKIALDNNHNFKLNIDNEIMTSYKRYRAQLPNYDLNNESDIEEMNVVLRALGFNLNSIFIGDTEVLDFIESQKILSDKLIAIH